MDQFEQDIAPTDIAENNSVKPRNIKIDEAIKRLFSSEKQALIRFINFTSSFPDRKALCLSKSL